jgi:hypothetical protein
MIFMLTGNMDEDSFLTAQDMPSENWNALMSCHHSGQCDDDVDFAARLFEIEDFGSALDYIVSAGLEKDEFVNDCGMDEERVLMYYLWILAGNIQDMELEN